jgi:hypothetical protein
MLEIRSTGICGYSTYASPRFKLNALTTLRSDGESPLGSGCTRMPCSLPSQCTFGTQGELGP